MPVTATIEGTWEEIAARSKEFAGHRVRLTFLDAPHADELTDEEYKRLLDDFSVNESSLPVLPEEANSREWIYGERD